MKARTHHPTTGLDVLRVEKVAKAQAWQRTGRAGREAPGKCYRTYPKDEFERMKEMPIPEIQRCSLAGVALQLLAIGVDITTFDFMDKPPKEAVDVAVECLAKLGAVKGIFTYFFFFLYNTNTIFFTRMKFNLLVLEVFMPELIKEHLMYYFSV